MFRVLGEGLESCASCFHGKVFTCFHHPSCLASNLPWCHGSGSWPPWSAWRPSSPPSGVGRACRWNQAQVRLVWTVLKLRNQENHRNPRALKISNDFDFFSIFSRPLWRLTHMYATWHEDTLHDFEKQFSLDWGMSFIGGDAMTTELWPIDVPTPIANSSQLIPLFLMFSLAFAMDSWNLYPISVRAHTHTHTKSIIEFGPATWDSGILWTDWSWKISSSSKGS